MKGDRDWRPSKVNRNYAPARARKAESAKLRVEQERQHIRDHDGEDEFRTRYDPKQWADREERLGKPWMPMFRSAYVPRLGEEPQVAAGDRAAALARANEIERILEEGMAESSLEGVAMWTRNERIRLKRMAKRWRERARGENAYFNIAGNAPRATEWQWANIKREKVRLDVIMGIRNAGRGI